MRVAVADSMRCLHRQPSRPGGGDQIEELAFYLGAPKKGDSLEEPLRPDDPEVERTGNDRKMKNLEQSGHRFRWGAHTQPEKERLLLQCVFQGEHPDDRV